METLFTWLHLSDLRLRGAGASGPPDMAGAIHEQILAALRDDLAERAEPRPDAMLVTGDVTAHGTRDEAAAAGAWLVEAARALGLVSDRIFVVPGDHDVHRAPQGRASASADGELAEGGATRALELRLLAELRDARRSLDAALDKGQARAVLGQRLAPFAELARGLGARSEDPRLEWAHALEGRGGLRIRLVGLCTAWLSLGAADRGKLRLGEGPLARAEQAITMGPQAAPNPGPAEPALSGEGELCVVLSHHPVHGGWLADEEAAAAWMRAHAHVHLTGHTDEADADEARAGALVGDGSVVWIAAGGSSVPARDADDGAGLGWSLVKVARAPDGELHLSVTPRRWSAARGRFVADPRVVREGRLSADLRLPLRLPGAPRSPAPVEALRFPAASKSRVASQGIFEGPGGQPAARVPAFTGRDDAMAALRDALADPDVRCVVVGGLGGVGKSALVEELVAAEARDGFEESAWIDAADLPAGLARVARRLAGATVRSQPSQDEAIAALRGVLEARRVLLVIDGIATGTASVRDLPVPSAASASRLVVTSRILTLHEDLGRFARAIRLAPLPAGASRDHLREAVPGLAGAPDALVDRLARAAAGLPLALRAIAQQLARPGLAADVLAERLERDPIGALDEGRAVTAAFQASIQRVGGVERRVILALAACGAATRADVVGAVAYVRPDEASLALEGLAEQSLCEHVPESDQPFRLHPVVRALLGTLPGARTAETTHEGWVAARLAEGRDLDRDADEILAAALRRARKGDGAGAWQALSAILGALDRQGRYVEIVAAATRVLEALPPEGVEAAAVLCDLGVARCSLGDVAEATSCFERALIIAEDRRWHEGQALALGGLGRCYAALGEWETALSHHQRAASIDEVTGRRAAFANDLGNLGLACRRTGDVPGAIDHLQHALAIHEEVGNLDGRAEVLGGLGLCFRDVGEQAIAADYFRRALAIHEELGRRAGQATNLGNLGNTLRALGEIDLAIDALERALAVYEELGLLEGQGTALANLGACYRTLREGEIARDYSERALAVLRRAGLGDDHPHVQAMLAALAPRGAPRKPR